MLVVVKINLIKSSYFFLIAFIQFTFMSFLSFIFSSLSTNLPVRLIIDFFQSLANYNLTKFFFLLIYHLFAGQERQH